MTIAAIAKIAGTAVVGMAAAIPVGEPVHGCRIFFIKSVIGLPEVTRTVPAQGRMVRGIRVVF